MFLIIDINFNYFRNKYKIYMSQLLISNNKFIARRQKYCFGVIREELDARDKEILIPFEAKFMIGDFKKQNAPYSNRQQNKSYSWLKEIRQYISQLCEIVCSTSFANLNKGLLTESEAKAFASKNLLSNIHSVLSSIRKHFQDIHVISKEEINDLINDLTLKIDEQLKEVIGQFSNHYPQAPAAGETYRMREVLAEVNRTHDENNDLIYANDISIEKYLRRDQNGRMIINQDPENYTGFVMEVINKAIMITGEITSVQQEETINEKFSRFSQALFYFSQRQKTKETITKLLGKTKERNGEKDKIQRQQIAKYFLNSLKSYNKAKMQTEQFKNIESMQQVQIEKAKKTHKYSIAQKIPSHVKHFSNAELKESNFHVNSSAVLRVMTKWAQYLQQIFEKSNLHITQRLYDFKTISNQLETLDKIEKDLLCDKLSKEYIQVKKQLKILQEKNTLFQSYILSQDKTENSYLKRFTDARSTSSQINAVLIQFTRKYICILIHHLIIAGCDKDYPCINLVVFRIGDLLRSKLQCNESSFINVLNTLKILDQSKEIEGMFKLVRIKNKLNDKDKNVLINYMFMGKVQCQLQLSIQDMAKKDKNYYSFCHFLYQLKRGKFGVITQCATIVCQHDSVVNSCKESYYRPNRYQKTEERKSEQHKIHEKNENIYKCFKCQKLIVRDKINLFVKQNVCNQCIAKSEHPEERLSNVNLIQLIKHLNTQMQKRNNSLSRIYNYGQMKDGNYVLSISNNKVGCQVKLYIILEHQRQQKVFMIQINQEALQNVDIKDFNFSSINYFDINNKKEKNVNLKELTYIVHQNCLPQVFKYLNIGQRFLQKLPNNFKDVFISFRIEKCLTKSIKFRNEILDFRDDPARLKKFGQIAQAYFKKERGRLMYKKYSTLEYSHIKKLYLQKLRLEEAPTFLKYVDGGRYIDLRENKLKQISFQNQKEVSVLLLKDNLLQKINVSNCINLTALQLQNNKLESIDLRNNPNIIWLNLNNNNLREVILCYTSGFKCLKLTNQCSKICQITMMYQNMQHKECKQLGQTILKYGLIIFNIMMIFVKLQIKNITN